MIYFQKYERLIFLSLLVGQVVSLSCGAVGNPAPHLSCLHNGKVLHSSDKYRITEDGTLVINHLMEDIDKVVCHVNNIYGEDHIEYKVGVVKPPLAPTLKVRKITDSLISLSWNLPHNGGALLQGL